MLFSNFGQGKDFRLINESNIVWAGTRQNQQNDMCTQQRRRPAWASAQSDQSLHCPPKETLGP